MSKAAPEAGHCRPRATSRTEARQSAWPAAVDQCGEERLQGPIRDGGRGVMLRVVAHNLLGDLQCCLARPRLTALLVYASGPSKPGKVFSTVPSQYQHKSSIARAAPEQYERNIFTVPVQCPRRSTCAASDSNCAVPMQYRSSLSVVPMSCQCGANGIRPSPIPVPCCVDETSEDSRFGLRAGATPPVDHLWVPNGVDPSMVSNALPTSRPWRALPKSTTPRISPRRTGRSSVSMPRLQPPMPEPPGAPRPEARLRRPRAGPTAECHTSCPKASRPPSAQAGGAHPERSYVHVHAHACVYVHVWARRQSQRRRATSGPQPNVRRSADFLPLPQPHRAASAAQPTHNVPFPWWKPGAACVATFAGCATLLCCKLRASRAPSPYRKRLASKSEQAARTTRGR